MASKEEKELSNCVPGPRKILALPKSPTKPKTTKERKKPTNSTKRNTSPAPAPDSKRKRQATQKIIKEPDRKLIVAVDFGTTFSAIAWVQTRNPEVQTAINQWPDATSDSLEGVSSEKVPTEIVYDGNNYKWGFQIEDSVQRHQWFKLDLDPLQVRDSPLASKYIDPLRAPPAYDPSKLGTDFLTAIRQHVERVLREKLLESTLLQTPIEYIVTVPAVWSDMAQATTRKCAEAAGMGAGAALHMISEPEAAALYALSALDPHGIKIGDTFMLCDAGGGTVDLITYKVVSLKPILKLAEASPGSGSLCGASFLNRRFGEYLEKKLGNEPGWDEEVMEEAMKRFEGLVKRQFRGTFGEEFKIPGLQPLLQMFPWYTDRQRCAVPGLQDDQHLRIRKNKMTLTGIEVKAIFEPVVQEVLRLVTGQINAAKRPVKAVILVGGFGQNAYLRDAIRNEVKSSNVEVLQSPNSWTAVIRGALMKGLASISPAFAKVGISERSARKHYGINSGTQYYHLQHGSARKIYDACSGFDRTYMMDWFIEKGNPVKENKPVRLNYQRKRLVSRGPFTTISTAIYHSSDPQNSGAPKHVEDDGVTHLVNIEADLSRIPARKIPQIKGDDNQMYYELDYAIQVTCMSAYTAYELIHGGVNYGLVTSEYV